MYHYPFLHVLHIHLYKYNQCLWTRFSEHRNSRIQGIIKMYYFSNAVNFLPPHSRQLVVFVKVLPLYSQLSSSPALSKNDGLHPRDVGATEIARRIASYLLAHDKMSIWRAYLVLHIFIAVVSGVRHLSIPGIFVTTNNTTIIKRE